MGRFCGHSFVVTNGASSRAGSLHLSIQLLDRVPPTLQVNAGVRVHDGSSQTISAQQLQLIDPDTAAVNLTYVITQPPRHGQLLLRGVPLSPPPSFTQADVDSGDLTYRHSRGSPAGDDQFHVLPSDGTNRGYLQFGRLTEEPAAVRVQVR